MSLNRWIYEPIEAKDQKLLMGNNVPGKCLQAHLQHFFSPRSAIEKKFAESAFFSFKNQKLVMKPLEKHQKLLLGNNVPGKCLQAYMQHFFSPSPAIAKNFAETAFFSSKNQKLVIKPLNLRANGGKTPKNYSLATMPLASAFPPKCNISSALDPLKRTNSLSQHLFIQQSKTCHETVEFMSQWGQNTKTTPG